MRKTFHVLLSPVTCTIVFQPDSPQTVPDLSVLNFVSTQEINTRKVHVSDALSERPIRLQCNEMLLLIVLLRIQARKTLMMKLLVAQ